MMNAISDTGGMTVSAMTAGGSGITKLNLNFGSAAKPMIIIAMMAATLHGSGMTALNNTIRKPATIKKWEIMSAPRAGITGMNRGASTATHTSSTLRNGMPNAKAATINGTGMTAIKRGFRKTALKGITKGGLVAGGSGIERAKFTPLVATRAEVTTGSMKTIIGKSAPTKCDEQYYFATVHLAAERTCASYLA